MDPLVICIVTYICDVSFTNIGVLYFFHCPVALNLTTNYGMYLSTCFPGYLIVVKEVLGTNHLNYFISFRYIVNNCELQKIYWDDDDVFLVDQTIIGFPYTLRKSEPKEEKCLQKSVPYFRLFGLLETNIHYCIIIFHIK